MAGMFDYNNKPMSVLQRVMDAWILGVLWLLCSVPVFTAGAASTAFYYAYHKCVRRGLGYAWREFFNSFKSNFKQATKTWLILLGLTAVLMVNCYLLLNMMQTVPGLGILLGIMLILLVAVVMWGCILFAYIARFEADLKTTMKNAAIMLQANLFWGIALVLVYGAVIYGTVRFPFVGAVAPTLYMFLANQILERVFDRYIDSGE